jgi:ketosteroid isomerase-like protein
MSTDLASETLVDRLAITDTIYRYASCIDRRDLGGVRAVFADDIWARYGNSDPVTGGDALIRWIEEATAECVWQHHLLSVYHVDVDGDRAKALVYHTSHQVFNSDPDTVCQLIARYHNELRRETDGWKISKLLFEILWGERRKDMTGYLAEVGGRGPQL